MLKSIIPSSKKEIVILILLLVAIQLIGLVWAPFTTTQVNGWYDTIEKPFFNPPGWIFGPVWTILYLIIGFVAFFIYKNKINKNTKNVFYLQLLLNFLWTPIFFILHQIGLALIIIIALLMTLVFIQIKLFEKSRILGSFWILYLIWVSFATLLNLSILLLN